MDTKTRAILIAISLGCAILCAVVYRHEAEIDGLEKKIDIVIKTQNEQLERERTMLKNSNTFLESQKTWNEGAFALIMETNKLSRETAIIVNVMARKPPHIESEETMSWRDWEAKQMTSHDPDITVSRDLDAIIPKVK